MDYEKGKKIEDVEDRLIRIIDGDFTSDYKPLTDDDRVLSAIRRCIDIIRDVLDKNN